MPRGGPRPNSGGARPGAGRPNKTFMEETRLEAEVRGMTPLDYMLSVMQDPNVDFLRRDRMAVAAAPYVHAKAESAQPSKKEQAKIDAATAEQGTEWEALLN